MSQAPIILSTGALARYPLSRKFQFATRKVQFADFSRQTFPQLANPLGSWVLNLSLMQDSEVSDWINFWEGQLAGANSFVFIDPWDNLLQYSEIQESAPWGLASGSATMAATGAVADPFGIVSDRPRIFSVTGSGAWAQTVAVAPAGAGNSRTKGMTLTLSLYVRQVSGSPTFTLTLADSSSSESASVSMVPTSSWQRFSVTHTFLNTNTATAIVASISASATSSLYVFGAQLEAAGSVSGYKQTTAYCGLHPKCFFATDEFDHQASGFNVNTISQLTIEESN